MTKCDMFNTLLELTNCISDSKIASKGKVLLTEK